MKWMWAELAYFMKIVNSIACKLEKPVNTILHKIPVIILSQFVQESHAMESRIKELKLLIAYDRIVSNKKNETSDLLKNLN